MKPIAVIGAGGFVGARMIERSALLGDLPLVPIVRTWRSQGRLARFGVRTVQGDAGDSASLVPLLEGCGTAVNLTMGDDRRILSDVQSMYAACRTAGVPVMVHMSSAEVFGRADNPNLAEDSVPDGRHWMKYGRAKAAAEAWLRSQLDGSVKIVILRPGLIWGPGSGWLAGPARELLEGRAFLFNHGRGICNLVHVDNLIAHTVQVAKLGQLGSGVFNVADLETHTWADYYSAIAREIGADGSAITMLSDNDFRESLMTKLMQLTKLGPAPAIKRRMSGATKVRLKQRLDDVFSPPPTASRLYESMPSVSKQFWWIQGTVRKLPSGAFAESYPDLSLRSFPELMSAAGRWLRYAGFDGVNVD